ncbi:hypothetical protein IFT73_00855 [Aeromicrobium sp. CFBP 8757]|uniref:hypothetical protein n=1 Tax=Aeromicrobium sp. CFBP 8757 TaxID=2775288 RepID=UPI00177E9FCE|nr:hypothetical protein [Aeromicrobium sp. CFBP 8757]MBD8605387.1 hypothetical protein [Aeromicrobium sp. CFBP 8757]
MGVDMCGHLPADGTDLGDELEHLEVLQTDERVGQLGMGGAKQVLEVARAIGAGGLLVVDVDQVTAPMRGQDDETFEAKVRVLVDIGPPRSTKRVADELEQAEGLNDGALELGREGSC